MPITLDGSNGITTPTYGGADTAEYLVPVTGFKNRIINGAMQIDQRNNGASITLGSGSTAGNFFGFPVDRFAAQSFSTTAGNGAAFTAQRNAGSITPPAGFTNYIGITVTSTQSTLQSDSVYRFIHRIEGLNVADLGWGTANAQSVTIGFWARSSVTGTFGGVVNNAGGGVASWRSYGFTYTINAVNTWEFKTVTINGDTSGTWQTNNNNGIEISFSFGVSSNWARTPGVWAALEGYGASGTVNLMATNGATFYITGVQLEVGSTATSFDYRPYGTELALCQRYAYSLFSPGGGNYFLATGGSFGSGTNGFISLNFPQVMRATPSLSPTPTAGNYQVYLPNGGTYQTLTSISLNGVSTNNFALLNFGIASGGTAGQVCYLNSPSSASPIIFSAEL